MKPLIITISIVLLLGSSAFAMDDSDTSRPPRLGWVNFGGGFGSSRAWLAFTGVASYSTTVNGGDNLLSFRYGYATESVFSLLGGHTPEETIWDLGALYGAISKRRFGFVSAAAGLAVVGGVKRGAFLRREGGWFSIRDVYEVRHFHTVGMPLEAQAFFTPLPFFGLGLELYANLNPVRSYKGLNFCLQFGRLR
jgi:hypothetical protein